MFTDKEIIALWESKCKEADDASDETAYRIIDEMQELLGSNPHYLQVICDEYARQFPEGPPPGTPGVSEQMRQRLVDKVVWPAQRRRN